MGFLSSGVYDPSSKLHEIIRNLKMEKKFPSKMVLTNTDNNSIPGIIVAIHFNVFIVGNATL